MGAKSDRSCCSIYLLLLLAATVFILTEQSCQDKSVGSCIFVSCLRLECSKVPRLNDTFPNVRQLQIKDSEARVLEERNVYGLPNLIFLRLIGGKWQRIDREALKLTPKLETLDISGNQFTSMPYVAELKYLQKLEVGSNQIAEIRNEDIDGCFSLQILNISRNLLTKLPSYVFNSTCLFELHLSHNPKLSEIEEDAFYSTRLKILNVSYTNIATLPRKHLLYLFKLNVEGSKRLKILPLKEENTNDYNPAYTFPFLVELTVEYNAHCCQVTNQRTLEHNTRNRSMRSAPDYVCLNTSSGALVSGHIPSDEEVFDDVNEICHKTQHCFDDRCHDNCADDLPVLGESGDMLNDLPEIACIESHLTPAMTSSTPSVPFTVTSTVCSYITPTISSSSVSSGMLVISQTTTLPIITSPTTQPPSNCPSNLANQCRMNGCTFPPICLTECPDVCKRKQNEKRNIQESITPSPSSVCSSIEITFTTVCSSASAQESSFMPSPTAVLAGMTAPPTTPTPTLSTQPHPSCTLVGMTSTTLCLTPSLVATPLHSNTAPSPSCSVVLVPVASSASQATVCLTVTHSYEPSSISQAAMSTLLPSTATEVLCSDIDTIPVSTPRLSPSSTPLRSKSPEGPQYMCARNTLPVSAFRYTNETVLCIPGNDAFNPCNDIFESNVLRVAVWIVILLAIIGNITVIIVTLLHLSVRYSKGGKDIHIMFILYLNLAFADLCMGVYLLCIAIEDIITLGSFSEHAVDWQTGPGCKFAGFCAIVSCAMSVYTLLVITLERVYSIKYAMELRQLKKGHAAAFMVCGWVGAIIIGVMPVFGLSSYERVSICLPFETRGVEDLIYVISLLVATGLCTIVIFVSYVYLFILVISSSRIRRQNSEVGREELCLALRMFLLVFTNFACWFPIALLAITAAFGKPLISVNDSKILAVFIFPINSCLNPFLYSFSTKIFRHNLFNLLSKCGLFTSYNSRLKARRSTGAYLPTSSKSTSKNSRKGSLMTRLLSISSFNSSRRNSTMSSNSASSTEEHLAVQNPTFEGFPTRHRLSIASSTSTASSDTDFDEKQQMAYYRQPRLSQASLLGGAAVRSLQAVPEEIELPEDPPNNQSNETESHSVSLWFGDTDETNSMTLNFYQVFENLGAMEQGLPVENGNTALNETSSASSNGDYIEQD